MNKLTWILILASNSLLLNPIRQPNGDDPGTTKLHSRVAGASQEPAPSATSPETEKDRRAAYQLALKQVAATQSMQQLHANYAKLGSPFQEMSTVQFADLFHRSQGFSLPGTREVSYNMYLQGWSSEIPALSDPEPDDCTPEEIEAWYRKFYDPWNAKRPGPAPWARELPFVDPQPHHRVQPGFTVIDGRGYRWGIVLDQNARGDYQAIGQLKPDFQPEPTSSGK
jgi:hypothetical protein